MTPQERTNTHIVEVIGAAPDYVPMRAVIEMINQPATVTFYDKRHGAGDHGQKISSYWLSTLFNGYDKYNRTGLSLDGGIPAWTLDTQGLDKVMREATLAHNQGVIDAKA